MPEFSNPFTVLKNDRKLTHEGAGQGNPLYDCGGVRGYPALSTNSGEYG